MMDRYTRYELGEQPCRNFCPQPHDDIEHECPKCSGWRRFCNACSSDHHSSGWDMCFANRAPVGQQPMTMTFAGIALPPAAERAYRAGRALAEAEDIAIGSQALIDFLAGWLENNPGDRACVTTIADFLDDFFHERWLAAADNLDIDCGEIAEERRWALEKLARGERR